MVAMSGQVQVTGLGTGDPLQGISLGAGDLISFHLPA